MAKYKRSDIAEEDIFANVRESAQKALSTVSKFDDKINSFAKNLKASLGDLDLSSIKGINQLLEASKELNAQTLITIKQEKEKLKLQEAIDKKAEREARNAERAAKNAERQRVEEIKLQQAREKNIDAFNRNAEKQNSAYNKLQNKLNDLRNSYKNLAAEEKESTTEAKQLLAQITKLDTKLKNIDASTGQNTRSVGRYENAWRNLKGAMLSVFAIGGASQLITNVFGTEVKLQGLRVALKNVTKDNIDYANSLKFINDLSLKYGQDLTVLTDTYKNFRASAKSSGLSISEQDKIYQSIIKSGGALNLSNEQIEGSLLAVSQMFSKGKVSAEELRGQLGERLPGAFGLMAKALNVSEAELGKMMEKGEVMAKDALPLLAQELEKTYGSKAQENLKTVGGAWNVMKTNLANYVSEANKGGRITEALASGIGFVGKNLDVLIPLLLKVVGVYVTFAARSALLNMEMSKGTTLSQAFSGGVKGVSNSFKEGWKNSTGFAGALKSIGWTALIALAAEFAFELYEIASGAANANAALKLLNATKNNSEAFANKTINSLKKEKDAINQRNELLKAQGKITEAEFNKRKQQAEIEFRQKVQTEKKLSTEDAKRVKLEVERLKLRKKILEDGLGALAATERLLPNSELNKTELALARQEALLGGYRKEIELFNVVINDSTDSTHNLSVENAELSKSFENGKRSYKGTKDEVKQLNTEFEKLNDYTERQVELNKQLNDLNRTEEIRKQNEAIQDFLSNQKQAMDLASQKGETPFFDDDTFREMIQKRSDLEQDAVIANTEFQIKEIENRYAEMSRVELEELNRKRKELLAQENLIPDEKAKIEANYQEQLNVYKQNEVKRVADKNAEIKVLEEQSTQEIEQIARNANAEIKQGKEDLFNYQNDLIEKGKDLNEKRIEDEKKAEEDLQRWKRAMLEKALDYAKKNSEDREKLIDKEIASQEKLNNHLQTLAENGNITAQQSLLANEEILKEKNMQKAEEAKMQEKIEEYKLLYQATQNYVEQGDTLPEAGGKAFAEMKGLKAIFNAIKGFYKGTETTVAAEMGAPMFSGKDGYVIRVDGSEKILNPYQSAITGNATTTEIVNGYVASQKSTATFSDKGIVNRLESLERTIQNKPEIQIDVEQITSSIFNIVRQEKLGNVITTTRTRY